MADRMTATAAPVRPRGAARTLQGFSALAAAAMRSADAAWLAALRQQGAARFAETGLPGSKDEEWRFTSLQALASASFVAPSHATSRVHRDALTPYLLGHDWPVAVFVDGRFVAELSELPASGATVTTLAAAIAAGHPSVERHLARYAQVDATPFTAVNAALVGDGALLEVPAGVVADAPIHILHVTTAEAAQTIIAPRILVLVGAQANVTVIESYASLDASAHLTNAVVEMVLGAGARVEHVRIQRESRAAWHVGFTAVEQARDSHYRSFTLALGGALSRHDLHARLSAPNVETLLYGLYLGRDEQLVDNHTTIFHDQPACRSWEVYKGVLTDHSHGVFNGKVIVQPVAQQTDAKQTNRNLLLSDRARVDTKPQLEIFADDVKCTHGATVGRLDEQQRYYLQTRGIAGRSAEVLLITAFIAEVLIEIAHPGIRTALQRLVDVEMDAMIG
jgi:Fe-S cluster assembly protein SufD